MTAATIDADEAWRLGMVSRIVTADNRQVNALAIARRLKRAPRGATRRALRSVRRKVVCWEQSTAERDAVAVSVRKPDF